MTLNVIFNGLDKKYSTNNNGNSSSGSCASLHNFGTVDTDLCD